MKVSMPPTDGTTAAERSRQTPMLDVPAVPASARRRPLAGVCTLSSRDLDAQLRADPAVSEYALVGPLTTENLGIETLIRTVLRTPTIRFVILCGQEARGHYGGQALLALLASGLDERGTIIGARGPRAFLANVSAAAVDLFRQQITPIDLIDCIELDLIRRQVARCVADHPGPFPLPEGGDISVGLDSAYEVRASYDPLRDWVQDPSGFFVVELDRPNRELLCTHYLPDHQLHAMIRGDSAAAVLHTIVQYQCVSRLDHAAYLGRELQKAELALLSGLPYEQDVPLTLTTERQHT